MTTQNVDLRVIGIFALVGFPYTLKFLWAPLMDRFTLPWMGRRRGWILTTQLLLAGVILLLGASSPASMPWMVASLAVLVAFFSASQDIVVDAYRTDVLHEKELGAGAATAVTGYRIALLVSGGLAFILADHLPWRFVYGLMAAIMVINTLFTFWAPEPAETAIPPRSLKEAAWGPLASFFRRPGAIEMLAFIVVYKLSDNLAGAMTTPFLLGLGFSLTDVGMATKFLGLASTIIGALAGGSIISRIGINRSLWIFAFLQAICILSFTWLALVGKNHPLMLGAIAIENISGGMGTAAFTGFMMSLCDKRFSATQYALLTSLMALGRIVLPSSYGIPGEVPRLAPLLHGERPGSHTGHPAPSKIRSLELAPHARSGKANRLIHGRPADTPQGGRMLCPARRMAVTESFRRQRALLPTPLFFPLCFVLPAPSWMES